MEGLAEREQHNQCFEEEEHTHFVDDKTNKNVKLKQMLGLAITIVIVLFYVVLS